MLSLLLLTWSAASQLLCTAHVHLLSQESTCKGSFRILHLCTILFQAATAVYTFCVSCILRQVLATCPSQLMCLQRHILPYNLSPYVALALRLHRLVANDVNPWAFFRLVDKASYRLGLWLHFLFPKMRYLYLTRLVSAAGTLFFKLHSCGALCTVTTLRALLMQAC